MRSGIIYALEEYIGMYGNQYAEYHSRTITKLQNNIRRRISILN